MDLFNSTLKNELGEDYVDLIQIIDDYLQRPRRSERNMINDAEKLCERVAQATADIEGTSQLVPETAASNSISNPTVQSTKTERPQSSQSSNSNELSTASTIVSIPRELTKPEDDDVVYISSEPSDSLVIDLRTPNNLSRKRSRRRAIEGVITLDDTWPEPDLAKRTSTNSKTACTVQRTPAESQSSSSESEVPGLKLKCPICMDDALTNEPTTTICGHMFCKKCIHKAIKITKKCPMCKKKLISTSQAHRLYF